MVVLPSLVGWVILKCLHLLTYLKIFFCDRSHNIDVEIQENNEGVNCLFTFFLVGSFK